ncbi:NAD-dependent epimerase/dehydratase family protein [Sulfuriferula nivalis]|uniref:3-beta hydroxysteroid dehydrogenase n=1 Tax=Sulfuriferula nivalis TaxID=2675298 RepID=A0A809RGG4_9PROT|nr:NAD(P)-dependent oxidoreductase [Sulfuriferula nivalis]BBO99963.1 3-beta hydroxysteroid dehydrogenase [Sulfuriferula nivalis]
MKTVLVTGANGFVGSHIIEALQMQNDVHIIAACRDPEKLPKGYKGEIRIGDLRDKDYRETLVKGVDVLCHAAAWTSLWDHAQASNELYLQPTLALIETARAAGVKRFINTSTTSASSPLNSSDAMSHGIPRTFWPHLCNVVAIEDALREQASTHFQVINLRLGIFAGHRYGLGILPILTPRLKTHLVPWVAGGRTSLPIVDGRNIGQAFALAAITDGLADYEGFNIVGPQVPTVREVIILLSKEFNLPSPHFSVPFAIAYPFTWLMEKLDAIVPWEPLVTRSIIHLMEEVSADNSKAEHLLGYKPTHTWQEAVRAQMHEMQKYQKNPMSMSKAIA